jgi:glycosyltransferase involved in cell wall biosynthesis
MRVAVLVSNDLTHDQRVRKICDTLRAEGCEITLIGRLLPESVKLDRPYRCVRFRLPFRKGTFFYAALNLRMFWFLMFHRTDVIHCNDLDTLLAGYLASRLKSTQIVYDSHEYFTESEGLSGRPFPKRVWERIERAIFPKLRHIWTVNQSIAEIYRDKYGVPVSVVRNIPGAGKLPSKLSREELGLPANKKIAILQGAYLDRDRGTKEAVLAARHFPDDVLLLIIGSGNEMEVVRELAAQPFLTGKVIIKGKMPYEQLMQHTMSADLGLIADKDLNMNYRLSLPNKLFDYIRAGIPVLAPQLPELSKVILGHNIGTTFQSHEPEALAGAIIAALHSPAREDWQEILARANDDFSWENEEPVIRSTYESVKAEFESRQSR